MKKEYSLKLFWIGLICLILYVPLLLVSSLASERKERRTQVVYEIGQNWGGSQILTTPFLRKKAKPTEDWFDKEIYFETSPSLEATQTVEIRKKGNYKIPFYLLKTKIYGEINSEEITLSENLEFVIGVKYATKLNDLKLKLGNKEFTKYKTESHFIVFSIPKIELNNLNYSLEFTLSGSEKFHLLPLSNTTKFILESNWSNPSFTGLQLPLEREITKTGFKASWNFNLQKNKEDKINLLRLYHNNESILEESFGVDLIFTIDTYHLVDRVIKYGFLFIGLTIGIFFLFEAIYSLSVHIIQYVLIGLSLVLFYLLLLSFSEYIPFSFAYSIAALSILIQISSFGIVVLKSKQRAIIIACIMFFLYSFLLLLINLEEHSLLAGSIALFIILSLSMYLTRNVEWDKIAETKKEN
jgi:inner membrane protein